MTVKSMSSVKRQAGAEYLLLDSGTQLHACPISYPRQKVPLLGPGIHITSGARLQHDVQTSRRTDNSNAFHACAVQKPIFSLDRLPQQVGTGVIFSQTLVHCSFLTRSRRSPVKHSRTRKRVCSLSKGCLLRPS